MRRARRPSASTGRRAGSVRPIYDNESGDLSLASRYDEVLSEPERKIRIGANESRRCSVLLSLSLSPLSLLFSVTLSLFLSLFLARRRFRDDVFVTLAEYSSEDYLADVSSPNQFYDTHQISGKFICQRRAELAKNINFICDVKLGRP